MKRGDINGTAGTPNIRIELSGCVEQDTKDDDFHENGHIDTEKDKYNLLPA